MTHVVFRGNFKVPFTTECDLAAAMEEVGCTVVRLEEDQVSWPETVEACQTADVFYWVATWDYSHVWPQAQAHEAVAFLNERLPCVGSHLDLFFGLHRQPLVNEEAWFRLAHVFTADGDHDDEWKQAGVNHHWLPPAIAAASCYKGAYKTDLSADLAFVGSWQGYGHGEWWPQRKAMLDYLTGRYGARFRCWPPPGSPAVRMDALNGVIASAKVIIGDSCLASTSRRYFSDRAFETVGRCGFYVSPYIEGLAGILEDRIDCVYYPPGDFDALGETVDWYLEHSDERIGIAATGMAHVKAHETYADRVRTVFETIGVGCPA